MPHYGNQRHGNQNRTQGGYNQRNNQRQEIPQISVEFLNDGFLSGENIRFDLCDEHALKVAEHLRKENRKFSTTQLRRFFNDIRSIEARVCDDFDSGKYMLSMLKAKVAYAVGRGSATNVPVGLKKIIDKSVDKINNSSNPRKQFDGFVHFFEAIVGFFTFLEKGVRSG